MAVRKLVFSGDKLLTKTSRTVDKFDARLGELIDDMAETMRRSNGVGIAAPQVGVLRRVVVIEATDGEVYTLVNPEIIEALGEVEGSEGCLSVPDVWGIVARPERVTLRAQDRDGKSFTMTASEYVARIICHEIDHLNGVLFTDKVIRYLDDDESEGE